MGLPNSVIDRAELILKSLEKTDKQEVKQVGTALKNKKRLSNNRNQLDYFNVNMIYHYFIDIDLLSIKGRKFVNNRINQVILLLGLLFIAICSIRTISSPEFWSHLAQASYGFKLSWIQSEISSHISYLYDHILMFFGKNGGVTLISILNIVGILTSFYLLIRISSKYGNILSNSIALIISGHLVFHSLEIGPGTIMLLFITLSTYAFIFIRNKKILYTTLIIIQIIWANLHHSFLFGPLLISVGLIHLIKSPSRKSTIYPKDIAPLIPILFLISLINPNGLAIYTQTYSSLISPNPIYWFSISNDFFSVASVKPIILFVTVLCGLGLITHKKTYPFIIYF